MKLSGKHPLNQQDQDLYSWRVSLYRETNYSPISCVLNSSKSSDFKGISLDLQLCKWEENQTPEKKKEKPLSGYVDFLGRGKKVQAVVCGLLFFFFIFFFPPRSTYLNSMFYFIIGFQLYTSTFFVPHAKNTPVFNISSADLQKYFF